MPNEKNSRVRQFTPIERLHLIRIAAKSIAREVVKGLVWDRLKIWRAYAIAAAIAFSAILLLGAEIVERWQRLLHALWPR